ncbi:MAG: SDR family oxidoreductase [Alphaproteobacteria bacterium]|nr:SDR family oxidoreductase [Alphaproteobacteria bacterium]
MLGTEGQRETGVNEQTRSETALVTGAAHRIGRTIALDLGRRGYRVAVHYNRSRAAAEAVAEAICTAGGAAITVAADLGNESDVRGLIGGTAALGPLTCLINNASEFEYDDLVTATRASWDRHIEANLRAPFVLTQAFAQQLPPDRAGNVINLIDQCVWNLTPTFVSYTVSKAGLWTLTRTLALALAPRVRVNAIGPGPTLPSARQSPEAFARQRAAVPLRRGASPEEIADAVRFILAAPALTGQMIALDGGQHLVPGAGAADAGGPP